MNIKHCLPERYSLKSTGFGGGMGDILICKDNHLDRDVIVKLLKDGEEERRLLDDGFAPIFPDICYHLTHYKPAAADIPV
ncbi:hypothetical protein OSK54_25100, partial [Escherichia coli]|nr:hypothetical protein [Escherichia coli]